MKSSHETPFYQTLSQLTTDLKEAGVNAYTPLQCGEDITALYLRRQRRACMSGRESPPTHLPAAPQDTVRVMVVGETDSSAFRLAQLLYPSNDSKEGVMFRLSRNVYSGESVEVFLPSSGDGSRKLRLELYLWCDVILFCYDQHRVQTFRSLQSKWAAELVEARRNLAQDMTIGGRDVTSRRWPEETPLLLVGLYGDRLEGPAFSPSAVPSEEAMRFAVDVGASRVVQVNLNQKSQVDILKKHCVSLKEESHRPLQGGSREIALTTVRKFFLQQLLCAPPPLVMGVQYKTVVVQGAETEALCVRVELPNLRGPHQYYYYFKESEDPTGLRDFTPIPPQQNYLLVPPHCKPQSCLLTGVAQCFYDCPVKEIPTPQRYAAPSGYFDPMKKKLVLMQLPEPPFQLRITRDSNPTEVRPVTHHDGFYEIEETVPPISLAGLTGWRGATPLGDTAQKIVVQIESSDPTDERLPSAAVPFLAPPRLLPPKVHLSADGVVSMTDPNPKGMARLFYTVDGTTPSLASFVYRKPFKADVSVKQIQAIALPALPLSSPVVTVGVHVEGGKKPSEVWSAPTEEALMSAPTPRSTSTGGRPRRTELSQQESSEAEGYTTTTTTRSMRLREAYNKGAYKPPHHPFLLSQRRSPSPGKGSAGPSGETPRSRGRTPSRARTRHVDPSLPSSSTPKPYSFHQDECIAMERNSKEEVRKKENDQTLDFYFEAPIEVTHLTVVSYSEYPLNYTLYGEEGEEGGGGLVIAMGTVAPHTLQSHVIEAAGGPLRKLICLFHGRLFSVEDVQVHGRYLS